MVQRYKILIVDDEIGLTALLQEELQEAGAYDVELAGDGAEAINLIQKNLYDVVLLDMKMPRVGGKEVLEFIQEHSPSTQVIILSQYADLKMAVETTKLGAYEVLSKPYDFDQVEQTIRRAIERKKLLINKELKEREDQQKTHEIIGQSKAIHQLLDSVQRVADSDSIVLVNGPSGTGKELVANLIHRSSPRKDRPFVPVNCSSIPDTLLESELFGHEKGAFTNAYAAKPGLVEVANGGTLFLDEVGDISPIIQPKLLRFLETGDFRRVGGTNELKANVRVISATNKNLQEEARAGRFREDLLYRLNVITIRVPSLKDHREDISLLVEHFLLKKSKSKHPKKLSDRSLQTLMMYDWPGNVRELEHIIEGAIILSSGEMIDVDDLHLNDRQTEPVATSLSMEEIEKQHIQKVLKMYHGNRKKTAEALNISEKGLYLKIKEYGLTVECTTVRTMIL
ncbi:MAG: sigma-54-dependent Fis family transcriptional regulator [Ignavibacteriae bacterium]|nr:sigma-54-dependent Fis family transcriptional regulator [Ignavibacteria bacterium]MBI3363808.1 sigma-54-dependent Fis family transcriptional regulator [Ignavibacteriota bacterium]